MTRMRSATATISGMSLEMRRTETPPRGDLADQLVEIGLGLDVDADRRLVDDQDLGIGGEPLGDRHLLLVAAGEVADGLRERRRADLEPLDEGLRPPGSRAPGAIRPSEPAIRCQMVIATFSLTEWMRISPSLLPVLADIADAVRASASCMSRIRAGLPRTMELAGGDPAPPSMAWASSLRPRRPGRRGRGSRRDWRLKEMSRWPSEVESPRASSTTSALVDPCARGAWRSAPRGRSSATPASAASSRPSARRSAAFLPSRSTVTRSAMAKTSSSLWLTKSDGDAVVAEPAEQSEQRRGLVLGDRGGRLVEEQDLGFERQRLGDLDDLHLRHRQRARPRRGCRCRGRAGRGSAAPRGRPRA